jgi:ketosteroid isomerase-like protein
MRPADAFGSAAAIVRRLQEAYNRHDVDGVLAELDEHVSWEVPEVLPLGGAHVGHDEMRTFLNAAFSAFPDPRIEPGEIVDAGHLVVYVGRFTAVAPAGRTLSVATVFVFEVANGRITRMREFSDTAAILTFAKGGPHEPTP